MLGIYFLGVITLPVLLGTGWGVFILASRSPVLAHESLCPFCSELGWSQHLPRGAHRRVIAQLLSDGVHRIWTGRRLAHRRLWQAHFDARPSLMRRWPDAWKRYGLHPVTAATATADD